MHDKISKQNLNKTIASGAVVNTLGTIGKLLIPLYFVLVTRFYGTKIMGSFYLVFTMIDIMLTLSVGGINDGVLMFASKFHEEKEKKESAFYQILANGFIFSVFISFLLIAFFYLGGFSLLFEKYKQIDVIDSIKIVIWSLPFTAFAIVVVSATKSLIIMKWDALILGFFKPFFLILFSGIFYFISPTLQNLLYAFLFSNISIFIVSLFVFNHYFSVSKLLKSMFRFKIYKPLISFSIPQNLNLTFNTFITNLDIIMLGYFNVSPELIGFYGMGSQVVRNIRQIKLVFSGIYAPIIARLHKRGDIEEMNKSFSTVSRWTSTIAFPASLLLIVFKEEIMKIFHHSYTFDSSFMIMLLVPGLLACTVGLSGNILVMTGHSMWNLINSVTIAFANIFFNYFLIPPFGLWGAALATAIASTIVSIMQLIEMYKLVGVKILIKKIYKPYLAILPGLIFTVLAYKFYLNHNIFFKTTISLISVLSFLIIIFSLKFDKEDKALFAKLKK